jgi:hypothetical protein
MNARKRKQDQKEDALFEMEMMERMAQIKDGDIARIKKFISLINIFNPDWKSDVGLCLQLQDNLKNAVLKKAEHYYQ